MPILVNGKPSTPKIGDKRVLKVMDGKDGSTKYHIPYIKDGLVLHLDGINNSGSGHSNTTTTWKNLAGDDDVELIVKSLDWDDSSIGFDNTSAPVDWGRWINYPSDYVTIEVIAMAATDATTAQHLVSNVESGGTAIQIGSPGTYQTTAYIASSYLTAKGPTVEAFVPVKISSTYGGLTLAYYDKSGLPIASGNRAGVIGAPTKDTVYALATNPSGQAAGGSNFIGRIYAVRIYDKALSADEIAHNALVDRFRFRILSDTAP